MVMWWWGSYSQISPWFWGRPLSRSLSDTPTSLANPGRWRTLRLLRYPLPLPCSNQMSQIQPRVPMAPQEGTFLRPFAWWLIQMGCINSFCSSISLEATRWRNEEGMLSNLPIQSHPPLDHISPATIILGILPTPAPTSFICSLLKR